LQSRDNILITLNSQLNPPLHEYDTVEAGKTFPEPNLEPENFVAAPVPGIRDCLDIIFLI
jgi:hypothetical protein